MTTNNNKDTIHWEESTKHRDELKNKEQSWAAKKLINTINLAIKGYNNTIGAAAKLINVDIKLKELDKSKTFDEIMSSGGSSFALGIVDDAIKGVRRIGLPLLQGVSIFGWGGPQIAGFLSAALAPVEIAMDHLKDLMTNMAFSGLAAEIGDLKDGQSKLNSKVDAQGKLLNKRMGDLKSDLEGQLKQQGEKFDKEIKDLDKKLEKATGKNRRLIEEEKKQRQAQYQELKNSIAEVANNLNQVEIQLTNALNDFKNEVNERFEEQERRILANKRKIEEERRKREAEIQEINSKIKVTNTNLENLRQEKEEIAEDFAKYKSTIDQKTAQTQQAFEDTQAEYERWTKILETQIKDNEEIINEFQEDLTNARNEQAKQRVQQEEILEELQETNDILFAQQRKLNLVAEQMNDIQEEVHDRMDKLSQKLDDRINETLNIAKDTNQKLDQLTEEVQNIQQTTEQLQERIKKNKEETEKAKKEAKLANERLDNLLKAQALRDYSAEQSKLDKIQKSLSLKAEETKLLATLNLLQETKQLIKVEPAERDWKVGVKTGTVDKDLPETEGYRLAPNSWWERNYTGDQVKPNNPYSLFTPEWFKWEEENYLPPEQTKFEPWGERIKGEHESAYLTDPEKRKEEQTEKTKQEEKKPAEEETTQVQDTLEKIEELKKETLTRLQEIQHQIRTNLAASENTPPAPSATQQKLSVIQQEIQQKKQLFNQKQQKVKNLEKKPVSPKNQQQLAQAQTEQKAAERQLQEAQAQLSDPGLQLDQEIEKLTAETIQKEQEELERQWSTLQALSQQALQKNKNQEEFEENKENDLDKKLEELVQQLKEMEQSAAASQKTMSMFMLFLIIFLLEYVVYKRNGLPGLVVLNVLLAIAYYHRDTLKEYAELWGKYLLILGYVMGNVLAYSAPEQEKYKWPSVIGFNLAILGIYAYTLYQQKQEQSKIEAHYQKESQKISQEVHLPLETLQQIRGEDHSLFSTLNPLANIHVSQRAEQFGEVVHEQLAEQAIIKQKELEIQQQAETLQKAAEIEEKLKAAQDSLGTSPMSWEKIKTKYPEFANQSLLLKEFKKVDRILSQEKLSPKSLTARLARLPEPLPQQQEILSQLYLTPEQFISLSCQAQHLTPEEREEIANNYSFLTTPQKLQLINSGLHSLGINTQAKKERFVELNHTLYQEKKNFGLTTPEKEGVLRLLINTLNLSQEQRQSLENMGVSFFDASNWQVSGEQKDNLLKFGLSRIELTEEQQANLTNAGNLKNFPLSPQQKNILTSLSPLLKENRYSEQSLELINSLNLKFNNLSFLVNHQIIPNPHTDFGKAPNSCLTLKTKFLEGEQKVLKDQAKVQEKQQRAEEIQEQKLSIVRALLALFSDGKDKDLNISLSLDNWVKIGVLQEYQKNILLTLGFKTIPRYHYFELLIFAAENLTDYSWDDFLSENTDLAENYQDYLNSLTNQEITINKTIWEKFVSSKSKKERQIFKDLNLEELINKKINQALTGYQPPEIFYDSQEELSETEEPQSSTSRYDNLLDNLNAEESTRQKKKKESEAALKKLEDQERQRRETKLSEKDHKLKEQEERRKKEKELAEKEEQKREEARLAREKTLQEEQDAYFATKSKNLSERKKATEQALENQKKENELQEQKRQDEIEKMKKENETEQARLAQEARDIELKKEQELATIALEDEEQRQLIEKRANEEKIRIQKEIDERKRKDEEELKKKENQLLKEREEREAEITKMEEERKLAEKAEIENKALYEQEKKSRQDLERQRANTLKITAERMDAQRKSEALRDNNARLALNSILWYPMLDDEWNRCIQGGSHFDKCPTVQEGFNRYSNLRVNPSLFQFDSGKWVNESSGGTWTYSRASDLRKAVAICGNRWFTKSELENHIKNSVGESW